MAQETTKKKYVICDKCRKRIYDGEPAVTAWIDASYGYLVFHTMDELLDYFEAKHLLLDSEKDKSLTWYENKEEQR
jgi:hypothetical protein